MDNSYWKVYRLLSSITAMNRWDRILVSLAVLLSAGAALLVTIHR